MTENPTATNTVTITGTVDQINTGLSDFTFSIGPGVPDHHRVP
ncbi:MAG: hypothetical protein U5O39_11805 [Gammaproteobacteria bacterium]|nr:hypothetical protein [Gammaproteobacteria bacterium]